SRARAHRPEGCRSSSRTVGCVGGLDQRRDLWQRVTPFNRRQQNKAVIEWNPVFEAQMLTYLRLTGLKLGLVINFGERILNAGIHRVVNGLPEDLEINAKTQRRRDATQTGDAACL